MNSKINSKDKLTEVITFNAERLENSRTEWYIMIIIYLYLFLI